MMRSTIITSVVSFILYNFRSTCCVPLHFISVLSTAFTVVLNLRTISSNVPKLLAIIAYDFSPRWPLAASDSVWSQHLLHWIVDNNLIDCLSLGPSLCVTAPTVPGFWLYFLANILTVSISSVISIFSYVG